MRSGFRLAAVISAFLAFGTFAFSQSATTSLHGTISDANGAVVTGATVTLTNEATGFVRTVKTDDQGSYQFLHDGDGGRFRYHEARKCRAAGEQSSYDEHGPTGSGKFRNRRCYR